LTIFSDSVDFSPLIGLSNELMKLRFVSALTLIPIVPFFIDLLALRF